MSVAEDNKDYAKSDYAADQKAEDERSTQNNANNIRNAADVAIATKNPYAMAAGAAVKAADKATGGKSTEALAKGMTKANKRTPGGKRIQNTSNKLNESGASDKIGTAARMKNQYGGGGAGGAAAGGAQGAQQASNAANAADKASNAADKADKADKAGKAGGGQSGSLPSSSSKQTTEKKSSSDSSDDKSSKKGIGSFLLKNMLVTTLIFFLPFIIFIVIIFAGVALVSGVFGEFDDAMGMSETLGEETGDMEYTASSQEQQDFFDRVNNVKLRYQAEGKNVDAMKIVAIYHVLKNNGADIEYENVSESTISNWADAMFNNGVYDEETFKNNLVNNIFPSYLKRSTKELREEMADEVLQYIEDYNDFIGKQQTNSSCASIGSCTYDIKGFYVNGTNINKNMSISNLKVRLMQCAAPYGNGSYTTPISQDLVDFEKYVAGVAYAEVGDGAPIEQYKAQMVAARSFALSRPAGMGNSRGLKLEQENGQWILQISSCVADQVYCDIDQGCHGTGGSEGGYTVSGDDSSAWYHKPALPQEHDIRKAATETQGEVLVNSQGYMPYPSKSV